MNLERKSGILLHPTSLPGKYGIGDLGVSAYEFVDFLEAAGQSLWQVLPLGETSFGDSPYQSFSTFAGNTLLLSPDVFIKEGLLSDDIALNAPSFPSDTVAYGDVISFKRRLYKQAYQNFKPTKKFQEFCSRNEYWLKDYALFAALKNYFIDKRRIEGESKEFLAFEKATKKQLAPNVQKDYYYGAVWCTWEESLANREQKALEKWSAFLSKEIMYYQFLQFEFFKQWEDLKDYANKKGVQIIGDIPIFVAYDSADVWSHKDLFHLDTKGFPTKVAGVPPDYFSATGQLWGNPLYQWEVHKKENYQWWIERIKSCLTMADILRIDHFRGFESCWAIPFGDKDATGGKWVKSPGRELFTAIRNALGELPIIAENLGVITKEVTDLQEEFQFPGMKILQFAFDGSASNAYLPHNYPNRNAIVYTGTHDNDTTIGWYKKTSEVSRDHFRRYMNVDGTDPAWELMRLAASSIAGFAIFPLQDILSLDSDARMNTPSSPQGNWQFRFQKTAITPHITDGLLYLTKLFNRYVEKPNILIEKQPEAE